MHKHKINQIYDPRKIYEIAKVRSLMMGVNHYVLQTYFDFILTINLQPNATHRWHIQRKHELEWIVSNKKSFVDSKTFSRKLWPLRYWQNTFIRTWNYYYCVINVMLLLYLLAAVRKVENEFARALLKSWKRTSAHAFCRVPNSPWLMTSPNLWKIPALIAA